MYVIYYVALMDMNGHYLPILCKLYEVPLCILSRIVVRPFTTISKKINAKLKNAICLTSLK